MLKILPIIPSQISQIFDPLFLFYSHIITYYSCNFIVSVITMSTIYTVTIEQDIASADFSSESSYVHEIIIIATAWKSQSWRLFHYIYFQLFLYYACECSIIPRIILIKLQPIILKIMSAY